MVEKVKTVIGCYFLLPDFQSRGHPNGTIMVLPFYRSIHESITWCPSDVTMNSSRHHLYDTNSKTNHSPGHSLPKEQWRINDIYLFVFVSNMMTQTINIISIFIELTVRHFQNHCLLTRSLQSNLYVRAFDMSADTHRP